MGPALSQFHPSVSQLLEGVDLRYHSLQILEGLVHVHLLGCCAWCTLGHLGCSLVVGRQQQVNDSCRVMNFIQYFTNVMPVLMASPTSGLPVSDAVAWGTMLIGVLTLMTHRLASSFCSAVSLTLLLMMAILSLLMMATLSLTSSLP